MFSIWFFNMNGKIEWAFTVSAKILSNSFYVNSFNNFLIWMPQETCFKILYSRFLKCIFLSITLHLLENISVGTPIKYWIEIILSRYFCGLILISLNISCNLLINLEKRILHLIIVLYILIFNCFKIFLNGWVTIISI